MSASLPPLPGNPEPGSVAWSNAIADELAAIFAEAGPRPQPNGSVVIDVAEYRVVFHADRRIEVLPRVPPQPITAKAAAMAEIAKMPLTDDEWLLLYGLALLLTGSGAGFLHALRGVVTNAFRGAE